MKYGNLPLLIPLLATAYILTIYGLLTIAAYQSKTKRISPGNIKKASN